MQQYRLPGCRKWRFTLFDACRDYAFLCWRASRNCDEDVVEADEGHTYRHLCDETCWSVSHEYMQKVVDRYARLLVRTLKATS